MTELRKSLNEALLIDHKLKQHIVHSWMAAAESRDGSKKENFNA